MYEDLSLGNRCLQYARDNTLSPDTVRDNPDSWIAHLPIHATENELPVTIDRAAVYPQSGVASGTVALHLLQQDGTSVGYATLPHGETAVDRRLAGYWGASNSRGIEGAEADILRRMILESLNSE